jgi:ferredoxin
MATAKMARIQILRRITLGVFLVGLTVLTVLHQRIQGIPTIDSLDPFGGLETLLKFAAGGEIIKKLEPGTLVLFGGIVALGLVLSRFFCGWFCAFGALQGIFGWAGRKLFKKRPVVPAKLDRYLRLIKYPLLIVIIYLTWRTGTLVIRPYDPLAAYGHLSAGLEAVWGEFAMGFVLLVASLGLSIVYDRAFCKYLCPLGAVNAILSRVPFFRIKRVQTTCISCAKCDRTCSMNVDISKPDAIDSPECIGCMECVTACPTKSNSLKPTLGGRAVKLGLVVGLGFALYLSAAAIGQAAGFAPKSLGELAATGKLAVADIKGSSTWEMIAESYGVELERLYRETKVDMGKVPPATMIKDSPKFGNYPDFTPDTVRIAVAKILGLPYTPETEAAAKPAEASAPGPAPAAQSAASAEPAPKAAPAAPEALVVPADFDLEGTMSIKDVAAALGGSEEAVIAKLGLPADIARDRPLRDMRDQYGYSMTELKAKIKR